MTCTMEICTIYVLLCNIILDEEKFVKEYSIISSLGKLLKSVTNDREFDS